MKSNVCNIVAALAVTSQVASAHFTWVRMAHNGVWQAPTRYMRNKTEVFEERFSLPGHGWTTREFNYATVYPDYEESVRCGRDNMKHALDTEVLDVKAGDNMEFAHVRENPPEWTDKTWNCEGGAGACYAGRTGYDINHPGPLQVYLSKVPDGEDIHTYDGSGEWVKIYTLGFKYRPEGKPYQVQWDLYNDEKTPSARYNFRIPSQTPDGQYLIRVGLVLSGVPNSTDNNQYAQLYHSCAHINVRNEAGAGAWPKGVKFPDIMSPHQPGMTASDDMNFLKSVDEGYVYPGGDIWDGEKMVPDVPDLSA